jgi:hypothetical protein
MDRRFTMDVLTFGWLAISVAAVGGCSTGTNNEPMINGSNSGSGSTGSDNGGGSGASTGSSSSGSSTGTPSSGSSTGSGSGMAMTGSSGMSATGAAGGAAEEASTPQEASTPPEEAAAPTVSFATVWSTVIQSNCSTACHTAATKTGGLDMSSQTAAYTNLTSMTSIEAGCNEKLVVKGSAMTSLLCQKVLGMQPMPSCGVQMPKGGTPLSSADTTLIVDWINGGANP